MKEDLDKLVEGYFANQSATMTLDSLYGMIEEQIKSFEEFDLLSEKKKEITAREFILSLPKFTPSEAWGEPNSEARDQIMKYVIRATPYGKPTSLDDFQKYMDYFTRIFSEESRITSPGRIISTIILMESLTATLNSFGASTAGFIFEGWLAAMLGGKQEAERSEKGNLPIQDIIAFTHSDFPGVPMSLKLLTKGSTSIEGSYTNLVDAMDEYGQMPYVVALKSGGSGGTDAITVHLFNITQDNLAQVMNIRKGKLLKQVKGSPYAKAASGDLVQFYNNLSWPDRYKALQWSAGYSEMIRSKLLARSEEAPNPKSSTSKEEKRAAALAQMKQNNWDRHVVKERNALKENLVRGANNLNEAAKFGGAGWHLTQKDMTKSADILQHKLIGTIDITPAALEAAVDRHMKNLQESMFTLFSNVKSLSDNLTDYFVRPKRDRALKNGEKAIVNADQVKAAAQGMVEQEKQK